MTTWLIAFIVVSLLSLISIILIHISKQITKRVSKKEQFMVSTVFEYATHKWIRPRRNKFIARFGQIPVNTGYMTVTFWIDIEKVTPYWRNVFHISETGSLEWNPTGNSANLPYDSSQDSIRRPAVFITPNSNGIHICADTAISNNNPFNIMHPNKCMVGLIWNTYNGKASCICYINNEKRETFEYNAVLLQPDSDALLYVCDRFYGEGDFRIRDLKFFNRPLTEEEYIDVYTTTESQINTQIVPTGTKGIVIRAQNGKTWKNNQNSISLNSGNEIKVDIYDNNEVYNNNIGRIGLLQNGDKNLSVRHTNFHLYTHPFTANNLDFAWYLIKAGDGVHIYNDYDGGYYIGYDNATDSVLIVKPNDERKMIWNIDPMPSIEYVN